MLNNKRIVSDVAFFPFSVQLCVFNSERYLNRKFFEYVRYFIDVLICICNILQWRHACQNDTFK